MGNLDQTVSQVTRTLAYVPPACSVRRSFYSLMLLLHRRAVVLH